MNPYDTFSRQPNMPGRIGFWIGLVTLCLFIGLIFAVNDGLDKGIFGAGLIVLAIFVMFGNIFLAVIGFIISLIGLLIPMSRKREALFGFLFNMISLVGPLVLAVVAMNRVVEVITTMGNIMMKSIVY